ncbi:MAG: hypothetical protein KDK39_04825 [Leptospiraceae bacterium]|nr:hypothetical protein [Leptospiraceae bacterium]
MLTRGPVLVTSGSITAGLGMQHITDVDVRTLIVAPGITSITGIVRKRLAGNDFICSIGFHMNGNDQNPLTNTTTGGETPSVGPGPEKTGPVPRGRSQKRPEKGKTFWLIVAVLSAVGLAVDTFLVTPEDFIPVIGWLDEGMLGTILMVALSKLGIEIPILSRFFGAHSGKGEPPASN